MSVLSQRTDTSCLLIVLVSVIKAKFYWLFRILYAGFAGLNEFSELSALSYSPQMFAVNIRIQNPIEPFY